MRGRERRQPGLGGGRDEAAIGVAQGRVHHARIQAVDRAHGEGGQQRRGRVPGPPARGRPSQLCTASRQARMRVIPCRRPLHEVGGQRPQRIVLGFDGDEVAFLQPQAEAGHGGDAAAERHAAHAQPAAGAHALQAAEERRERAFRERPPKGLVRQHQNCPLSMLERLGLGRGCAIARE